MCVLPARHETESEGEIERRRDRKRGKEVGLWERREKIKRLFLCEGEETRV